MKNVLTPKEAARLLCVSESQVRRMSNAKILRGYRLPGSGHRRFLRSEVVRLCLEHGIPVDGDHQTQEAGNGN